MKKKTKRISALERLRKIKPSRLPQRFLISWSPDKNELCFGCGGGENAVTVSSSRKLKNCPVSLSGTKLFPDCVQRFLRNKERVEGREVLHRVEAFLREYIHFADERLYSLLALWIVGTYLYLIFCHYGYMFFYSMFPRSGKTRVEEILSHLTFEATNPLNSPTVPTIREMAAAGGTLILDTLECWREKSSESYAAAMEFLDAGFRNGGTARALTKNDPVALA
jgi:hypothetical protein